MRFIFCYQTCIVFKGYRTYIVVTQDVVISTIVFVTVNCNKKNTTNQRSSKFIIFYNIPNFQF